MFKLEIEDDFSSAHQLREYHGKCENLHGHNWKVKVSVGGTELLKSGMLIDFGDLKRMLKTELTAIDHKFLNELPPFTVLNPTSEQIAQFLYDRLSVQLPSNVHMEAVTVWESDKCRAIYTA